MGKLITVLDIGSNKIAASSCDVSKDGVISIRALANMDSRGLSQGAVTDVGKAAEDISSVIKLLSNRARKKIKNITVVTKADDIRPELSRGMVGLSKIPRPVTKKDISKCVNLAEMAKLPLDRVIIDKVVTGYFIDGGASRVSNPLGLYGIKLEAGVKWSLATVDATKIARELLGVPIVNTAMIGALLKSNEVVKLESLVEPLKERFGRLAERNISAMQKAYEVTMVREGAK